jgi:CubicO group peptidase (beta-lactamase class C family)
MMRHYQCRVKVPENEFTAIEKVTLRRLLSHSAGMTVHGFPGYAADAPIPSLVQILNGEKPANTPAIRVEAIPGSRWNYSGGGITVMQQLMIDLTSKPFPEITEERVLKPFGMTHSTYRQPLPSALAGNAAHAYQADGRAIAGSWHTYPEMAAAGLWTTPTDLAKFAIEVRRAALSQETAKAIITKQKDDWGLGFQLSGDRFGHGGANAGYRCEFAMYLDSGDGIAVMTNSDAGSALIAEVLRSAAAAYGWPDYQPRKKKVIPLDSRVLSTFVGEYELPGAKIAITFEGGKLWVHPPQGPVALLLAETVTQFFVADGNLPVLTFTRDEHGAVTGFQAFGQTAKKVAPTAAR